MVVANIRPFTFLFEGAIDKTNIAEGGIREPPLWWSQGGGGETLFCKVGSAKVSILGGRKNKPKATEKGRTRSVDHIILLGSPGK